MQSLLHCEKIDVKLQCWAVTMKSPLLSGLLLQELPVIFTVPGYTVIRHQIFTVYYIGDGHCEQKFFNAA